jgi:hypothetical protein
MNVLSMSAIEKMIQVESLLSQLTESEAVNCLATSLVLLGHVNGSPNKEKTNSLLARIKIVIDTGIIDQG